MRISATILPAILAAALAAAPAQSFAGARGPLVIRGLGPENFAPPSDHVRPARPHYLSSRWRGEEPADAPSHEPAYAPAWRPAQPSVYGQIAPAHPLYRIRYARAENPYDRAYRPGAYSAVDPFPPQPAPSGYFLDEGPSLYAR